jgi:hypothetical protein
MFTWIFLSVLAMGYYRDLVDPEEVKRRNRRLQRWHRGQNKYPVPVVAECRGESFSYAFMYCKGAHRLKAQRYR